LTVIFELFIVLDPNRMKLCLMNWNEINVLKMFKDVIILESIILHSYSINLYIWMVLDRGKHWDISL